MDKFAEYESGFCTNCICAVYYRIFPVACFDTGISIAIAPNLRGSLQKATGVAAPQACSPKPCAAPEGFEVDVANIQSSAGTTNFEVSFKNHTPAAFGSTSFRPTSPRDFQLRLKDGRQVSPTFGAGCPDWGELHVERGGSAGPVRLCFRAPSAAGAVVIWGPDLGLLFDDVQVPLDG